MRIDVTENITHVGHHASNAAMGVLTIRKAVAIGCPGIHLSMTDLIESNIIYFIMKLSSLSLVVMYNAKIATSGFKVCILKQTSAGIILSAPVCIYQFSLLVRDWFHFHAGFMAATLRFSSCTVPAKLEYRSGVLFVVSVWLSFDLRYIPVS